MYCIKCGEKLGEHDKYCMACGYCNDTADDNTDDAADGIQPKERRKPPYKWIIASLIGLLFIFFATCTVVSMINNNKPEGEIASVSETDVSEEVQDSPEVGKSIIASGVCGDYNKSMPFWVLYEK